MVMSLSTAAAYQLDARPLAASAHRARSAVYGGLVGDMIDDIDARMSTVRQRPGVDASPEDFLHSVSVAGGYAGLVAGFGAVAALIWTII
jgi:hypothetical protein